MLIFDFQQTPNDDTYNTVQQYLVTKNLEFIQRQQKLTKIPIVEYIGILNSDNELLWSTAPSNVQTLQVLLYQNYNSSSTVSSNSTKLFEDGSLLQGVSSGGLSSYSGGNSILTFIVTTVETK